MIRLPDGGYSGGYKRQGRCVQYYCDMKEAPGIATTWLDSTQKRSIDPVIRTSTRVPAKGCKPVRIKAETAGSIEVVVALWLVAAVGL